jgi:hypothetical protein
MQGSVRACGGPFDPRPAPRNLCALYLRASASPSKSYARAPHIRVNARRLRMLDFAFVALGFALIALTGAYAYGLLRL